MHAQQNMQISVSHILQGSLQVRPPRGTDRNTRMPTQIQVQIYFLDSYEYRLAFECGAAQQDDSCSTTSTLFLLLPVPCRDLIMRSRQLAPEWCHTAEALSSVALSYGASCWGASRHCSACSYSVGHIVKLKSRRPRRCDCRHRALGYLWRPASSSSALTGITCSFYFRP